MAWAASDGLDAAYAGLRRRASLAVLVLLKLGLDVTLHLREHRVTGRRAIAAQ